MDYKWFYELLEPYYCHDNGRPATDHVVLVKMVLIQHLFGIPSLRQTHREIQVNNACRWFLGYSLLDDIPHFATVSYAFCKRFPAEVAEEIFAHILNKAINNRMVDPSVVFIDGTHIKASANKKKHVKAQVAKTAKIYSDQLRDEVNAERAELGKLAIEDDDDDDPGTKTTTVSTTDLDSGMFVNDSVAWDALYDDVTTRLSDVKFVVMDSAYKTPWIAKKILDDRRIPICVRIHS